MKWLLLSFPLFSHGYGQPGGNSPPSREFTHRTSLTMGNSLMFCPSQPLGKSREKGPPESSWPLVNLPFSVDGVLPTALGRY